MGYGHVYEMTAILPWVVSTDGVCGHILNIILDTRGVQQLCRHGKWLASEQQI